MVSEKDKILHEDDARLINQFILKLKKDLKDNQ